MEYYSTLKTMNYQFIKRHEGSLNAYYVKEANLKWLHVIDSNYNDILEKVKLWTQKKKSEVAKDGGRGKDEWRSTDNF